MISIVDDDPWARQGINDLVMSMGYRTTTFTSAEEFIESGCVDTTACVIADLQMSGLSGLDLQGWLMKRGHRISFILVTGYPDEVCRTRALSAGAVGFLTKPVDDESLMRCLIAAVGPPN